MSGVPLKMMSCYSYNCWCEGIGCTNVVVRNCRFENCLSANSRNTVKHWPQIGVTMRIPPDYWPLRKWAPIKHAGLSRAVADNFANGRRVSPSRDAVCDILVEGNTFVNPRGLLMYLENVSRVTFRDNVVEFKGDRWDPLPCAGKIRILGGNDIDVPEHLIEKRESKKKN